MSVVDGPVPKHRQLREILLALVDADLTPDSPIPSERELVSRFGISRATVREAVGRLVSEGRLYRVRGKGTFVAAPRVESLLHLASFTEDMRRRGHKPSTVVLGADESVPPPPARAALGLDVTDRAYRIERLRSADGSPMAHEVSWLPARPLPGLLEHDLSGSVYTLLTREYGRSLDSAAQTVWAEGADPLRARLLRVPAGRTIAGLPADLVCRGSADGTRDILVPGRPVPGPHDPRSQLSCRVGVRRLEPSVRSP